MFHPETIRVFSSGAIASKISARTKEKPSLTPKLGKTIKMESA
jgi:hypothetical protein